MCIREKILLNLASVDVVEIRVANEETQTYDVYITTRGGGEKIKVLHTEKELPGDHMYESKEVLIYEPATGAKETLYDFVDREMLGKYEMDGRTGTVKYVV
jgi:ribosomal protein L7/L12